MIVGQGLAGSLLAWNLEKLGRSFFVIDNNLSNASSRIAAGIIHPITGRRIVKTWMADTLLPIAENAYKEIGEFFKIKIMHELRIMELLDSVKEYNDWMARSSENGMEGYIQPEVRSGVYDEYLQDFIRKVIVKKSCWIDAGLLLNSFRKLFSEKNILIEENFDESLLEISSSEIVYKDIACKKIIFCEGALALQNKFWKHLPFIPAKGELLTIRAEMDLCHILNRKIFILPLGNKLFRVGSTFEWNYENDLPSPEGENFLTTELKKILKIPFEIVQHQAGIRPTVKDRKPFLGLHKDFPQVGIFNGLGTKGCLLAPYLAQHLVNFLEGKGELMKEVNVALH